MLNNIQIKLLIRFYIVLLLSILGLVGQSECNQQDGNDMDSFEKKYGIKENAAVKNFHKSRRMFCIVNNVVHVVEPNVSYSHAVWFEKEGWMSADDDSFMNSITRGIVDAQGDVYFYTGYDFRIDADVESVFFTCLPDLVKLLNVQPTAHVYGGLIKQKVGGQWPPRKQYGTVAACCDARLNG